MKLPEVIKKGLELCSIECCGHNESCPFVGDPSECVLNLSANSLAYITQLESRLAQLERERDALMMDLQTAIYRGRSFNLDCEFCKDKDKPICEDCQWQWRGVCAENTEEDGNG